jgi:hypothetical protein
VRDRTKHSPQPSGVVMHPNGPELRQGHRPGMNLPDADSIAAGWILLVAETKAVVAPLALASGEADPTVTALGVSSEPSTQVDGGLLEHLGADFCSPGTPSDQLGRGRLWSNHEHPAGALAGLPAVEGVDQVKTRPRHRHRQVRLPCRKRVDDQLQALIEGKTGCPAVSGKRPRLLRCRVKREPERRVPHDVRSLPRRGAQYEHVFGIFQTDPTPAGSATSCEADLTDDLTGMLMTQLLDYH